MMLEASLVPLFSFAAAVALILLNGVFVTAEFAIVRVRRTRLEELAGQGVEAAKDALLIVDRVSEYLAVTQIGITIASLGVGWLAEVACARSLAAFFPGQPAPSGLLHAIALGSAFLLVTVLHVLLGELVPKNLAVRRAEQLLLVLARPLFVVHLVLRPVLQVFERMSAWILHLLGHGVAHNPPLTEDELKLVLAESHRGGVVTDGEAEIIVRAFEFADKQSEEVMIPAERVAFIRLDDTLEHNLEIARKNLHARLPVCRDGLDAVVGVVSMKDVWPLLELGRSNAAFERACRPPIMIPLDYSQEDILKAFQRGHGQLGIVRDLSDQRTLGIVTLEDILESLLGDLREPHTVSFEPPPIV